LIQILDEDHVVSAFVVDQFIDQLPCQQYAEPAWAKALLLSNSYMAKDVLRRIADGRMA
jgi:hypothetical protein